jgi:hypothetical protein
VIGAHRNDTNVVTEEESWGDAVTPPTAYTIKIGNLPPKIPYKLRIGENLSKGHTKSDEYGQLDGISIGRLRHGGSTSNDASSPPPM